MKVLSNEDYEKLVSDKREAAKVRKATANKLKQELKDLERKIEKATDKHERELEKKDLELERTKESLTAYKSLNTDSLAIKQLQIELETRERVLKAKEDSFVGLTKEIADNRKKAEEAREEGIKKGYADGVADGLREATKITAEDRQDGYAACGSCWCTPYPRGCYGNRSECTKGCH
jgi:hypothetical protein